MKTIIITGASSGIGFATASLLAHQGYSVIGVGHNEARCDQAREKIMSENPQGSIAFYTADLMQQREVCRVADELASYLEQNFNGQLHALINNAGCVRSWYATTEEGYEQQFALNHLAAFLLTYKLFPYIKKAGGRVIMTGSESHKGIKVRWNDVMLRRRYNPLTAYKQSKLCNILFARGLNDRYVHQGVRAYVVDPGLVKTDIGNKQTGGLVNLVWTLRKKYGAAPEIPARTFAYLCDLEAAPDGLYYHLCQEKKYSNQVTDKNADKLFALGERLCGIKYHEMEADI